MSFAVSIICTALFKKDVGQTLSTLINALFMVASTFLYVAGVRRKKLEVGDVLKQSLPLWLKMIVLDLLVAVAAVLSFIAFIVPFFIVMPRLALVNYYLVDKNKGVVEAFKASWAATQGNVGKVYGIVGATIAMALLVITIIGIPFAIYFLVMYSAVLGVLYEYLEKSTPATPAPVTPPAV
jgi:hypothetical protein